MFFSEDQLKFNTTSKCIRKDQLKCYATHHCLLTCFFAINYWNDLLTTHFLDSAIVLPKSCCFNDVDAPIHHFFQSSDEVVNINLPFNTLRPRQNGPHFADDISKRIFLNENIWITIKISQKFVPKGSITNIPALVQIMAWRRPGDKPLSEPMMVNLPTHICVTWPQWVNGWILSYGPLMSHIYIKCYLTAL